MLVTLLPMSATAPPRHYHAVRYDPKRPERCRDRRLRRHRHYRPTAAVVLRLSTALCRRRTTHVVSTMPMPSPATLPCRAPPVRCQPAESTPPPPAAETYVIDIVTCRDENHHHRCQYRLSTAKAPPPRPSTPPHLPMRLPSPNDLVVQPANSRLFRPPCRITRDRVVAVEL